MTSRAVSFWLNPQELCFQSGQELPPSADVVVIGGGITGVSTAYWLSHLGSTSQLGTRDGAWHACGPGRREGDRRTDCRFSPSTYPQTLSAREIFAGLETSDEETGFIATLYRCPRTDIHY